MAGKECKPVLPYLQRAQEMEKHDSVVAYYCRLYALELGMKLPSRGEELRGLIGAVMKQLEADKAAGRGPGGSREEDQLHVEGFAQQIFAKADKVDRAGCATVNTARSFYAAAIFFEVLGVFGAVDEEVQHMQKYAAWKAADIQKAIREGRKPAVGPPKINDGEEAAGCGPPADRRDLHAGAARVLQLDVFGDRAGRHPEARGRALVSREPAERGTICSPCDEPGTVFRGVRSSYVPSRWRLPQSYTREDGFEPLASIVHDTIQWLGDAHGRIQSCINHIGTAEHAPERRRSGGAR